MREQFQKIPTEFFLAGGVLLAILVVLVPLPSLFLDMLLVVNMGLAFLLLMLALSTEETSQLSVFPTLLLGMTMGRLVLNVASTRLILTQGTQFGGVIVRAFGSFVVGGSYGVGVILFMVLVCIQLMVISKGSERVAEVAARFALDGLSSKQVGIESRAQEGVLTPEEAEHERRSLQQKADFFGSMDGASKYVKGENLAGLLITAINFFGGITLALVHGGGAGAGELLETYALLTVGDGLVGLLPSMLLAVATGLVITKTEGDGSLGTRVMDEVFQSNRAAGVSFLGVGCFVLVLGVFSGVDPLGFLFLVVVCFSIAALFLMALEDEEEVQGGMEAPTGVQVMLHPGLLDTLREKHKGGLEVGMHAAASQLARTLGVRIPTPELGTCDSLEESCWEVRIHELACGGGALDPTRVLALYPGNAPGERLPGDPDQDPTGNRPAQLIAPEASLEAAELGCDLLDPTELLGLRVSRVLMAHARELFGQDETEQWLREAQERYPAVVREARAAHKGPEIKALLVGLLTEGVAIRQPRPILEALSQIGGLRGQALVEAVRGSLGKQIVAPLKAADGVLHALTLLPAAEEELKASMREGEDGGNFLDVPMDLAGDLLSGARARCEGMRRKGLTPCLVVSRGLRPHLYHFLRGHIPDLRVLAYEEARTAPIQNLGRLGRFQPAPPAGSGDRSQQG